MADDLDFESKTEPPSPRKREQAHEQGQFAHSPELVSGLILFVGVAGLLYLTHTLGSGLLTQTRVDLARLPWSDLSIEGAQQLFTGKFVHAVSIAGLLVGLLYAATLTVNFAQIGFHFNIDRLTMDWDRVALYHFDRLLGWSKIVRGVMLLLKLTAVAAVAWWILSRRGPEIAHVNETSLAATLTHGWTVAIQIALSLAGTLLLFGVIDYGYQRWQFERSLYMSKQELKDEMKREEGNPQIKARVRKLQRENARRKMFHKVPTATVVVTNPTHLAIALRYDTGAMTAPKVIAKGAGHVAKRIVMIARKNGVPVVERRSLAQALFKTVKIDQDIPLGLYYVVAELMAYVYQLKGGPPPVAKAKKAV
jgi:flagellar biosynthesis protein FlhB